MEKIFNHKDFNYFVWTILGSRVNIFTVKFTLRSHQPDIVPILPPVSTTLAKLVAKFAAGVVDTGGTP
jgi:hypothetical protein